MKLMQKVFRLIPGIVKIIAHLSEVNGTTEGKIIDCAQRAIFSVQAGKGKPKNMAVQVKKALKQAVQAGFIKQRGCRYQVALDVNDLDIKTLQKAVMRSFKQRPPAGRLRMSSIQHRQLKPASTNPVMGHKLQSADCTPTHCCSKCRANKKRRGHRRGSRRRRRRRSYKDDKEYSGEKPISTTSEASQETQQNTTCPECQAHVEQKLHEEKKHCEKPKETSSCKEAIPRKSTNELCMRHRRQNNEKKRSKASLRSCPHRNSVINVWNRKSKVGFDRTSSQKTIVQWSSGCDWV